MNAAIRELTQDEVADVAGGSVGYYLALPQHWTRTTASLFEPEPSPWLQGIGALGH